MERNCEDAISEDFVCDCGSALSSIDRGGWACVECGQQISISGRAVRDPIGLKHLGQFYTNRVGATPEEEGWQHIGYTTEDPVLSNYTYSDATITQAFWDAFGPLDVSSDDDGSDEMSG